MPINKRAIWTLCISGSVALEYLLLCGGPGGAARTVARVDPEPEAHPTAAPLSTQAAITSPAAVGDDTRRRAAQPKPDVASITARQTQGPASTAPASAGGEMADLDGDDGADRETQEARHIEELDEILRRETPDSSWTTAVRDDLEGAIADLGGAASLQGVECVTTLCRVELTVDDPRAGQQLEGLIADPDAPRRSFVRVEGPGIAVTSYLFRDDDAARQLLPDDTAQPPPTDDTAQPLPPNGMARPLAPDMEAP